MGLKDILSSLETKPVQVEIAGDSIDFYPVRLRSILAAQSVVADMAKAATSLFDPNADDYVKRTITKQGVNIADEGEDAEMAEVDATIIEAISPVHAMQRIARREKAIKEGVQALLDEQNVAKIAILIEDSSRGACMVDDIMNSPPDILVALLRGTLKANFSVFGGLAGKAMTRVDQTLGTVLGSSDADEESPE